MSEVCMHLKTEKKAAVQVLSRLYFPLIMASLLGPEVAKWSQSITLPPLLHALFLLLFDVHTVNVITYRPSRKFHLCLLSPHTIFFDTSYGSSRPKYGI